MDNSVVVCDRIMYSNQEFTYDGWYNLYLSCSYALPSFTNRTIYDRCYYMGKPVHFLSSKVKVMGHCEYCQTHPFEEDKYRQNTCAKCGAPIDKKEYYK